MNTNANIHLGSNFDDFLAEEAILKESTAVAIKCVVAWQIEQYIRQQNTPH